MMLGLALGKEKGLPSNQVHSLAQDQLGRLWLAGPSGLSRYDGSRVKTFDRRNGLQCAGLRAVRVGSDGTIWMGTDQGVEAVDGSGKPLGFGHALPWNFGLVDCVLPSDSFVWAGTAQGLVKLSVEGESKMFTVHSHEDVGFVRDLAMTARGVVALSSQRGILEPKDNSLAALRNAVLPSSQRLTRLAVADDLFLIGSDEGLFVLDHRGQFVFVDRTPPEALGLARQWMAPTRTVTAVTAQGNTWWVAYGRTLVRYDASRPTAPKRCETYALTSLINDLLIDAVGNVWAATDSAGAQRVSCLHHAIEKIDLDRAGAVYSIKQASQNTLRVSGELFDTALTIDSQGVTKHWSVVDVPTTIWDTLDDEKGGAWLATQGGHCHLSADGSLTRFEHDALGHTPSRLLIQKGSELLLGSLKGLSALASDGSTTDLLAPDGTQFGYVYTACIDAKGTLWLGTLGRGLWCKTRAGFVQVTASPLSDSANTYAIVPNPSGTQLLIIQDEKLVLLSDFQTARLVGSLHPVAGWTALWLDESTVAIGSSEGLSVFDLNTREIRCTVNSLLPLGGWEFTNNRTLVRGPDRRLYCGVNAGLVAVNLEKLKAFQSAPSPCLAEVTWRDVSPEVKASQKPAIPALQVPSGNWSLDIAVAAHWLVDEASLRFRFRLVGFEPEWSALTKSAEVRYSSLPPGRFSLEAQVWTPLTGFGPAKVLLELEVKASVLSTLWSGFRQAANKFYFSGLSSQNRNAQLLEENDRLESQLRARTQYLQSTNAQLQSLAEELRVASLTDPLTALGNRRHFDLRFERERERALRTNSSLGVLMVDVDYFKAYNDAYGHPSGDACLNQIATILKHQFRPYDFVARYGGEEFVVLLPDASLEEVAAVGVRLVKAIEREGLEHLGAPSHKVTISVGGASALTAVELDALVRNADASLYAAKASGRNCFQAVNATPTPFRIDG
jgi:diguanylate cyclase (GGDEF)-like protein